MANWKKILIDAWNHDNSIDVEWCCRKNLVKNKKALSDVLYRMKKNGIIELYCRYGNIIRIVLASKGEELCASLDEELASENRQKVFSDRNNELEAKIAKLEKENDILKSEHASDIAALAKVAELNKKLLDENRQLASKMKQLEEAIANSKSKTYASNIDSSLAATFSNVVKTLDALAKMYS